MILSRWIKNERMKEEIIDTIDFGLKDYANKPIKFAKYNFASNKNQASIYEWLTANSYEESQYIGFFNLNEIKNYYNNENFYIDEFTRFNTINFFTFNLNNVFSLDEDNQLIIKKKLDIPKEDINLRILREKNVLKYFTPPPYAVKYSDGTTKENYSNPGEIDIVANDMAVYGILCNHATNIIKSIKTSNDINYSDNNVNLLNNILKKIRNSNIDVGNDIQFLKTHNQLKIDYEEEFKNLYFDTIDEILIENNNINDELNKYCNTMKKYFIFDNENNPLRANREINIDCGALERLLNVLNDKSINKIQKQKFIINQKINEYIDNNFLKTLLYIVGFLNNVDTYKTMKNILDETNQNNVDVLSPNKRQKLNDKKKYIKYKTKYLELKKKLQNMTL